ncbi:DUF4440 domain-containing protein [Flavobacterium chungbukense]|uniref:DUF4440 domain-containing protein n=1 Tax=Flavobacterium chungbukense TaxID=877464 RepID=A0ABP7XME0_9FLAO|nr:DUF4440 domain-containing protein [Flavobacterium chungbukense]MCC4920720.1 DUF4440 domain-containing protein [Flavobacterium chungbukense]
METDIFELEKKYWQGMENHKYETVKNLTSFPCIIAGKNGVHEVDETNFKKMFESGDGDKIKVLGFSDVKSQLFMGTTGIIAYIIELQDTKQNKTMKCACTSTWIQENNNWTCALHTEAELSEL